MRNKTISISDEMYEKLKDVPNASGLIDCLLREYFKTDAPLEEKKKKTEETIAELNERLKKEEEERNRIIIVERERDMEIQKKTEEEQVRKSRIEEEQKIAQAEEEMEIAELAGLLGFEPNHAQRELYLFNSHMGIDNAPFIDKWKKEGAK